MGLDPGLGRCGYALLRPGQGVAHGCVVTVSGAPAPQRLAELRRDVVTLLTTHRPAVVGVEELRGVHLNRGVSLALAARGVIVAAVAEPAVCPWHPRLLEPFPQSVKKYITGDGRASKSQIRQALQALDPDLGPGLDDAMDAIAIAHWAASQPPPAASS